MIPESPYLYLTINGLTLLAPLLLSFDNKVAFYKLWPRWLPAMALIALVFIAWDSWFTASNIWGFNPRYLSGIYLGNLPVEEVLFFITVPYACVFVYECVRVYLKPGIFDAREPNITKAVFLFMLFVGAVQYERMYTLITFFLLALSIYLIRWVWNVTWLGRFYLAWLICMIPFLVVNGILTGSCIEQPVVWYNSAEHLNIRIGTIPFEDIWYGMLLVLLNVAALEWRRPVNQ